MFSFSYFLLAYFDPTKGFIKADSKSNSTHFIMNHHELLTLIQSCQAILTFLVNRGLLAAKRICSCGNQMVLRDNKSDDGYHWECPVNQCRKRRSIRAGTFFEDSKIPLSHWLYIIFLWSIDESNKKVSLLISNQEKAEGNERDSEEQTSMLPRRVQLAEMLPW